MPTIDLAKGEKKLNAGPIQEEHDQFDRVKAFEEL